MRAPLYGGGRTKGTPVSQSVHPSRNARGNSHDARTVDLCDIILVYWAIPQWDADRKTENPGPIRRGGFQFDFGASGFPKVPTLVIVSLAATARQGHPK